MTSTDEESPDLAADVPPRHGGMAPAVIALTAAVAFGAVDQYLPVAIPTSSHLGGHLFAVEVSGMLAPWVLLPFVAGAWQGGQRRAAMVGLAATWLAVLAHVLMIVSPMESAHQTPRTFALSLASQWPWFAGGLITGPLYGWLGHRWRARKDPASALLAALPTLLEPAARWLATRFGLSSTGWLLFPWPLPQPGRQTTANRCLSITRPMKHPQQRSFNGRAYNGPSRLGEQFSPQFVAAILSRALIIQTQPSG